MDLAKHISSHENFDDDEEKTRRQTKSLSAVKNQMERKLTENEIENDQASFKKKSSAAGICQINRSISTHYTKAKYSFRIYISQSMMTITNSKSPAQLTKWKNVKCSILPL